MLHVDATWTLQIGQNLDFGLSMEKALSGHRSGFALYFNSKGIPDAFSPRTPLPAAPNDKFGTNGTNRIR